MSKLIEKADGVLWFRCPGCKGLHQVFYDGGGWVWNMSLEAPTLTPSILVTCGHYDSRYVAGDPCWCTYNAAHPDRTPHFVCTRCHSHVTDGKIQFLNDSTHALAGQTVELPEMGNDTV